MGTMRTLRHPRVRGGRLGNDQTPAFGRSVAARPNADTHRHPPTPTDTHQHEVRVSTTTTAGHECESADSPGDTVAVAAVESVVASSRAN